MLMNLLLIGILVYAIGKVVDWLTFMLTGALLDIFDKSLLVLSIIFIIQYILHGGI